MDMKIKLSKSQWEMIGKKTGWMKKADEQLDLPTLQQPQLFKDILSLIEEEKEFQQHTSNIEQMEEATTEDLDAGYGRAISAEDFRESLQDVDVTIRYLGGDSFEIIYNGNYGPSSVNAGRPRRIVMGDVTKEEALELINLLKSQSVHIDIMPKAMQQLGVS